MTRQTVNIFTTHPHTRNPRPTYMTWQLPLPLLLVPFNGIPIHPDKTISLHLANASQKQHMFHRHGMKTETKHTKTIQNRQKEKHRNSAYKMFVHVHIDSIFKCSTVSVLPCTGRESRARKTFAAKNGNAENYTPQKLEIRTRKFK